MTTATPSPAPPSAAADAPARRWPPLDVTVLVVASVLIRLPTYLAERHLTFDDGVYGVSALAMRDGEIPFRDVFSPQGPAWLPLVWLFDLLGGRTATSPRLYPLVAGVVLTLATYACGRRLTDRTGALVAAGCTVLAGSVLWVTSPIAADGPAMAWAMAALAVALAHRERPTLAKAVGIGVLVGLALATKLVMISTGVPVAVLMLTPAWPVLRQRRLDRTTLVQVGAGLAALVVVGVATTVPFGAADVVDQYITYHSDAAEGHRDLLDNLSKIATTVPDRNVLTVGLVAAALVAGILRHRRGEPRPGRPAAADLPHPMSDTRMLVVWWVVTLLSLLAYAPLFRPHLVVAVPPLVLLAGMHRPPTRVLVALLVVLVPVQLWRDADLLVPGDYAEGSEARAAEVLAALPDGAWVISDEPGFAWVTGHRVPADLVDASIHRVETGRITAASLAEAAADPRVCAVQIWSPRYGGFEELPAALGAEGYELTSEFGTDPPRQIWTRPCPR